MNPPDAIDLAFEPLRQASLKRCATQDEYDLVLKAYRFAREAHKNQLRISKDPVILHCIAVALIVVQEIGLGCKSIVSSLLHHTLTDTDYTQEDIEELFGEKIAQLVFGLGKLDKVFDVQDQTTAETFKQMILTVNDDVRVMFIKLADRLHNIRHLDELPIEKRARAIGDSMYIFVPLAHRLGLYSIKSEMENIWMRYAMNEEYRSIEALVKAEMERRGPDIARLFIEPIQDALKLEGYHFHVYTRIKTPYSIWNKMKKRNVDFNQVYDLFAVRIVFFPHSTSEEEEGNECYHIEELLNEKWEPNPNRRRDWIRQPKETGYRALHSTYLSPKGNWIEVQIRSKQMDEIAEQGVAGHWRYKGGSLHKSDMEDWLSNVRKSISDKDVNSLEYLDEFQAGSLASAVYVFTPKGDMRTLPKGATALDFAYYIHTEVGNHALAAKINQKLVQLSTSLHGGDQVEIITTEAPNINLGWLDFLKTPKARSLVADAFNFQLKDFSKKGQSLLKEKLNSFGIMMQTSVLRKLTEAYGASSKEDLYTKIGTKAIDLSNLQEVLHSNKAKKVVPYWGIKVSRERKGDYTTLHLSDCCHPIPGNDIVGYINRKKELFIHRTACTHAKALERVHRLDQSKVEVHWDKEMLLSTLAVISIVGKDRMGLVHDVSRTISLATDFNMRKISFVAHDSICEGTIEIYVPNNTVLNNLIQQLKAIKGIDSVR